MVSATHARSGVAPASTDLHLLHEVSRALLFGLSYADIPDYLCTLIVERMGVRSAWLASACADGPAAIPQLVKGADPIPTAHAAAAADGPVRAVIANAKPLILDDLDHDPRATPWRGWSKDAGFRSAACLPLISTDHVVGVLSVFSDEPAFFDEERASLLQSLANLAAIALSEARNLELIRASQERLEVAMDAGHMGVWDWDLLSGRLAWEAHHARLFGMRPEELEGTTEDVRRCIHPDDVPDVERAVNAAREARTVYEREFRVVWPSDGSVHWIAARGRFHYDDAGRAVRMIGVVLDVDRRHNAEERAQRQQSELAHLSRLNLLNQLASGLAHEINQPLGAISNFAGAAIQLHRDGKLTPDRAIEVLGEIHQQSQRAGEIVRRLRGFMRKGAHELIPSDLNVLVADSVAMMGAELSLARVRASVSAADGLPRVRVDPVQIQQVIVNLIQNAIDAMADTPPQNRRLLISTLRSTEQVAVRFTDAGKGIAPADLPRIFDSFFSTKDNGLGLGLNISRSIVESHGGSLTARNKADGAGGGGATFEFVLPLGGSTPS